MSVSLESHATEAKNNLLRGEILHKIFVAQNVIHEQNIPARPFSIFAWRTKRIFGATWSPNVKAHTGSRYHLLLLD
jgi:hypothetical protein